MFMNWRTRIPMMKQPETFTNNVPTGNPLALIPCTTRPTA